MNKVITDGVILMPTPFGEGLDVWSSEDGRPGDITYDGAANATLISADADFGTCFELQKTEDTQKLRYMGETPLLPGCYLRVTARVKAMSGAFSSVRIAGWAGGAGGVHIDGLVEAGSSTALNAYGEVVEVSAIIGGGNRTGVDLVWGREPIFGHFGLDFTGTNGGVVRVEDVIIEDVTSVFLRKMMDVVDVQDYGAIGDGVTDNTAAFEAADADAEGRDVLVPEGTYYLAQTVTLNNRVRFEGFLEMPDTAILQLTKNFDLPSYEEAFGDELIAFQKGIQALYNFTDHVVFDLKGRSISLAEPFDVHAVVGNQDSFTTRRVIKNGELRAVNSSGWDSESVTVSGSYDVASPNTLSNVTNISAVKVGSLIEGNGVGREVYVKAVDVANSSITLSAQFYGASASQSYSLTRNKYLLDFSGFTKLSKTIFNGVSFNCATRSSAVMLAVDGSTNAFEDCYFISPKDRGITSIGTACQDLIVDRNQFLSNEGSLPVSQRTSIALNINANDAKIRNNRAVRFKHFAILGSAGYIITGNHWFQGDDQGSPDRTAGVVIADYNTKTTISCNYVDNSFIEWNSEHFADNGQIAFSFHGLTIADNIFTVKNVASWFRFIRIKPYTSNQFINGLTIANNVFKSLQGQIDRVDEVDTTFAELNDDNIQEFFMHGNSFSNIDVQSMNPATVEVSETAADDIWVVDFAGSLPFGLKPKNVTSLVPKGQIQTISNAAVYSQPYALVDQGANGNEAHIRWSTNVKGSVLCTARVDKL